MRNPPILSPAIFLDRDGVINKNTDARIKTPEEFVFEEGACAALARLAAAIREPIIIFTNQAAIGRGWMSEDDLQRIHDKMLKGIREAGGRIDAIYHCPHVDEDQCDCRKPKPGLLERAAQERGLDLPASFVIGDFPRDIVSGQAVGCRTIWIDNQRLTFDWKGIKPDFSVPHLGAAVEIVLRERRHR